MKNLNLKKDVCFGRVGEGGRNKERGFYLGAGCANFVLTQAVQLSLLPAFVLSSSRSIVYMQPYRTFFESLYAGFECEQEYKCLDLQKKKNLCSGKYRFRPNSALTCNGVNHE